MVKDREVCRSAVKPAVFGGSIMEIVQGKDLKLLRVARGGDRVYKDECVYCFNSPVSMFGGT